MKSAVVRALTCIVLLGLFATTAAAEVIELEGTIKSIDADARSIAITRQTPKGEKVLELEIARNAGDISGLKAGDRISFAYNPDVDIVSKIEKGSGNAVKEFDGHHGFVMAVACHPNGKLIASGGTKFAVRLWDLGSAGTGDVSLVHESVKKLAHVFVTSLAISPSGKLLASASNEGSVRIWDIQGPKPVEWDLITKNTGVVTPICFSPDGKFLATAERQSGITRLFDVSGAKAVSAAVLAPANGEVWSIAFSPDGKTLVAGMWFNEAEPKYGEVVGWDLTTTPPTRTVVLPKTGQPRALKFLPDGKSFVFGDNGLVRRFSFPEGKDLGVLDCYPSDSVIAAISVSPDGKYVAVGGNAKEAKVVEIATGKEIDVLKNDYDWVEGIAFSPDGKSVVIGSKDSKVRVWRPQLD